MRVANKVSYHRGEKSVDGCLTGVTTVAVETAVVMKSAAMATMTAAVGAWSSPRRCHCRQRRTGAGGGRGAGVGGLDPQGTGQTFVRTWHHHPRFHR